MIHRYILEVTHNQKIIVSYETLWLNQITCICHETLSISEIFFATGEITQLDIEDCADNNNSSNDISYLYSICNILHTIAS